jgi:hypothetical protein
MRLQLTEAPLIRSYVDLTRRPGFTQKVPVGHKVRGGRVLGYCGPFGELLSCGNCSAQHERLFLVRFFERFETLVGEDCCELRFKIPDYEQQVRIAILLNKLVTERRLIRNTLARRDEYAKQIATLKFAAKQLEKRKFAFECAYPKELIEALRFLGVHPVDPEIVGAKIWDGNSYQKLNHLNFVLDQLEYLAVCVPDEEDTDSVGNVEAFAAKCAGLPDSIALVKETLEAGNKFFADKNLGRLPRLMRSDAGRWTVRQITKQRRRETA